MTELKLDENVSLVTLSTKDPKELTGIVATCAAQGKALKIVALKSDAESRKVLGKRVHDVVSSTRTLRFVLEALQSGYKFDDAQRDAKLASLERAVTTMEREGKLLEKLLF